MAKESLLNYKAVYYLLALFVLNAILKLTYLDARDIALDEPFTIFHAQAGFSEMYEMLKTENNPPFFFILLHFWIKAFGISPFAVRLLPFIFSVLTPLVIFKIGDDFFERRAGLIAGLVFTFSNYHIFQAHDVRVYSLFALLTACALYYFLKMVLRHDLRLKNILLLSILNILLIYSHFFGWWIPALECLCMLFFSELRKKDLLKAMAIITTFTLLSYTPYLKIFFDRFLYSAGTGTWVEKPIISDLYTMLWRFSNAPVTTVWVLLLFLFSFILFLLQKKKETGSKYKIVQTWFFLPYLLMFLIAFKIPVFLDKYVVYVTIPFCLLIAFSILEISKANQKIFYPIAVVTLALFIFTTKPNIDNKRRVKELVELTRQNKKENTLILISPHWFDLTFMYHYNIDTFKDYHTFYKMMHSEKIYSIDNLSQADSIQIKKAKNVILIDAGMSFTDPALTTYNFLKTHFEKEEKTPVFETMNVYNFY